MAVKSTVPPAFSVRRAPGITCKVVLGGSSLPHLLRPRALLQSLFLEAPGQVATPWKRLLCGTRSLAMWSLIDIIVVTAGVLDQWLFVYLAPYLPVSTDSASNILGVIRLMRLVRVVKVIAFMLDWDLSWTEGAGFQSFIGGVIAVNALLMGCETDIDWGGWLVFENFLLCPLAAKALQLQVCALLGGKGRACEQELTLHEA
eukprot:Skav218961  [mRNA]  locus=scaffold1876:61938:68746:- [translate_table: standard]